MKNWFVAAFIFCAGLVLGWFFSTALDGNRIDANEALAIQWANDVHRIISHDGSLVSGEQCLVKSRDLLMGLSETLEGRAFEIRTPELSGYFKGAAQKFLSSQEIWEWASADNLQTDRARRAVQCLFLNDDQGDSSCAPGSGVEL